MRDYFYSTNIHKKINQTIDLKIYKSICCWSDLLGFGSNFSKNNWLLTKEEWETITRRLVDTQNICFENVIPTNEYALVLNDGIVRNYTIDNRTNHIQILAIWIRSCIKFHIQANMMEKYNEYPGIRTVIAAGDRAQHNFEDIRFDDFVFNYTKPDPEGLSSIAQENGNPIVCYNPKSLQMNTAFSKAFIIDEIGSKQNISGAHLYIDQSVIEIIKKLSFQFSDHCGDCVWVEKEDYIIFGILKKGYENAYHIGFELFKPVINFDTKALKTEIWRVKAFYVHDEQPEEFKITLSNIDVNNSDVGSSLYQFENY